MPAPSPKIGRSLEKSLQRLGQRVRDRRKQLGVNATTTAEAAGLSRVTLYRIERGEPSVAMGAYLAVISALGLEVELMDAQARSGARPGATRPLPKMIPLSKYPQLKRLAWQLKDTKQLTPDEALELYERNWRHVDLKAMDARERELIESLLAAFGRERLLV